MKHNLYQITSIVTAPELTSKQFFLNLWGEMMDLISENDDASTLKNTFGDKGTTYTVMLQQNSLSEKILLAVQLLC